MKTIKHLFLFVLLCCLFSVMALANDGGGITITVGGDLTVTVTDTPTDSYTDEPAPLIKPPKKLLTAPACTTQLTVYNSQGQLVYTGTEPVCPNSTLQLDTKTWEAGEYTVVLTQPDGTCTQTTFKLK